MARISAALGKPQVRVFVLVSIITCALSGGVPPTEAASTQPGFSDGGLSTTGTNVSISPAYLGAFNPATVGAAGINFSGIAACLAANAQASIQGIIQSWQSGSDAGTGFVNSSAGGTCQEESAPDLKNASCDMVETGGTYDPKKKDALATEIAKAIAALQCKKTKLTTITNQLTCLTAQAQDLTNWVNLQKARYTQAINTDKSDLAKIQAIEDSRADQLKQISYRLNGDPGSGAEGLRTLKSDADRYVQTTLPGNILNLTQAQQVITTQQLHITELIKSETARIAANCFKYEINRTDFRCGRTGSSKPVSYYDFALCRENQNSYLSPGGQVQNNAGQAAVASQNQSGLQSILDAIFRDMDIAQTVTVQGPNGPSSVNVSNADRITTPQDITTLYGAQLAALDVPGFDTADFVEKGFAYCYNKAAADIPVLEQKPGEQLYDNINQLNSLTTTQTIAINKVLTEASELYNRITKDLTGLSIPVDPTACRQAAPPQQLQCLNDLETNMTNMVSGVGATTAYVINVTATDPTQNIQFSCNGVDGCVAAYEGFYRAVDTEVKRVDAFKKTFVSQSNQNLTSITEQLQQQAQQQLQPLNDYVTQLNNTLSQLGIGSAIEFQKRSPERPTFGGSTTDDGTKIMDAPVDLAAFLGLPDLDSTASFGRVRSDVANQKTKIDQRLTDVQNSNVDLTNLAQKCQNDLEKDILKSAQQEKQQWMNAKCGYQDKYHLQPSDPSYDNSLNALVSSINNMKVGPIMQSDVISLSSGLDPNQSAYTSFHSSQTQLNDLATAMANLQTQMDLDQNTLNNLNTSDPNYSQNYTNLNNKIHNENDLMARYTSQQSNLLTKNSGGLGPDAQSVCDSIYSQLQGTVKDLQNATSGNGGGGNNGSNGAQTHGGGGSGGGS